MISIIVPAHNEKCNLEKLIPLLKGFGDAVPYEILVALSSKNSDDSEDLLKALGVNFLNCTGQGRASQDALGLSLCANLRSRIVGPAIPSRTKRSQCGIQGTSTRLWRLFRT